MDYERLKIQVVFLCANDVVTASLPDKDEDWDDENEWNG